MNFDRVYLLEHPASGAGKVGIASNSARVKQHAKRGYRLVAQWFVPDPMDIERRALVWMREQRWPPIAEAPEDGMNETFPHEYMDQVSTWINREAMRSAQEPSEDRQRIA